MRCMIVLISCVKLWIIVIVQSGDCIRDCVMDSLYLNDLGGIFF